MLDATLPAPLTDPALEQALLALAFADNANLDRLDRLAPEDLVDPFLGAALAAALNLHAEGRPANLVSLKSRLEAMPLGDGRTGLDALRALTLHDKLPSIEDIAHRLRSLAIKRRLQDELRRLANAVSDESQPLAAIAADGIRQLNDYLADAISQTKTSFELHPAAHEFIAWLQGDGDPVEITTGLVALDETLGGWHRGQFALLGGRPSMGKSAIASASMLRTAAKGHGVLFFSLEMTKQQIVARALADFAYGPFTIAYSDLKPRRVPTEKINRLLDAAEAFKGLPLEIETRNGLTVGDILAKARKTAEDFKARGYELDLVVVDHLLKVRPSNRYAGQPVKEIDEVSDAMCVMAKSLNVAVLGLHQLNRQPEQRDNHRPVLADLRQSGTLEQDADIVLFAYPASVPVRAADAGGRDGSPGSRNEARRTQERPRNPGGEAAQRTAQDAQIFCRHGSQRGARFGLEDPAMTCFGDAAAFYVGLGWKVFPLAEGAKVPAIPASKGGKGFKDATHDADLIARWERAYPRANIGIATGAASDVIVVDIDPRNGGNASVVRLAGDGFVLPPSPEARTGNGGRHLFYAYRSDIKGSKDRLGKGIDIKTDGGYVVAAPSVTTPSQQGPGGGYRWIRTPSGLVLPALPQWLADKLIIKQTRLGFARVASSASAERSLEGMAHRLAGAAEGQRNDLLNWAAFMAGGLVREGKLGAGMVTRRLTEAALAAGLPMREVQGTIASGLRGSIERRA